MTTEEAQAPAPLTMWQQYFLLLRSATVVCIGFAVFVYPIAKLLWNSPMRFVALTAHFTEIPYLSAYIFCQSIFPLTAFFFVSQHLRKSKQECIWQHLAIAISICLIGYIVFYTLTAKTEGVFCSIPSHGDSCHVIALSPWYQSSITWYKMFLFTANFALCAYLYLYILSPSYPTSKLSAVLNKLKMMVKEIVQLIKKPIVFLLQSIVIVTFFSIGTIFLFGGAAEFGYNQSDFFPVVFAAICQIFFILLFFYFPISLYTWKRRSKKVRLHIAIFIVSISLLIMAQLLENKLHWTNKVWQNYLPTITMSFCSILLYLHLLKRSESKKT